MLVGTFNFKELAEISNWPFHHVGVLNVFGNVISLDITITAVALLIFCGAVGKSAQFPLHVWLPDAMEGPTPVSALIHAATMVAAGVYMLSRVYFLISDSVSAMAVIAAVGAITALMSAVIATQQSDIKRILAYSTLSQLGLMVMAIGGAGAHGYSASMFHLTTHAFFKALLFLGAGSLIIGLHHEQNIWKMGGLSGKMWLTFVAFLVGALALMGVPGFSGFYSKEDLLCVLYAQNKVLFVVAELTVFFTAFYMTRLLVVAFIGLPRSEAAMHARESGPWMIVPLLILSVFSWIAGSRLLRPQSLLPSMDVSTGGQTVFVTSMVMLGLGFTLAALIYWNRVSEPLRANILTPVRNKFYFDELYDYLVRNIQGTFALLMSFIDQWVIEILLFRGSAALMRGLGDGLRRLQTGSVQVYAFLFGVGAVFLIWWELIR
jgi:NADH-quinone oxidoreductase subunit L